MERTNYVDKAKSLMMKAARTTALVIVPLAAAVSAHAGSIALPIGSLSCSANDGGNCSSGSVVANPDLGSGVQGISFSDFSQWNLAGQSGSSFQLLTQMQTSGNIQGDIPVGTTLPVAWNMNLGAFSGALIQSWSLTFELGNSSGSLADLGIATSSGSGAGLFSGSGSFATIQDIAPGSLVYETVLLTINATNSGSGTVTANIPPHSSLDFNSVASVATVTPEPASVGLMGAGLAFFGALVRRRRKQ